MHHLGCGHRTRARGSRREALRSRRPRRHAGTIRRRPLRHQRPPTVLRVGDGALTVRFDDGRDEVLTAEELSKDRLDHAYAVTVHRMQGATVDRAHVFADGGGRELAYVAMSRARESLMSTSSPITPAKPSTTSAPNGPQSVGNAGPSTSTHQQTRTPVAVPTSPDAPTTPSATPACAPNETPSKQSRRTLGSASRLWTSSSVSSAFHSDRNLSAASGAVVLSRKHVAKSASARPRRGSYGSVPPRECRGDSRLGVSRPEGALAVR